MAKSNSKQDEKYNFKSMKKKNKYKCKKTKQNTYLIGKRLIK